MRFEEEPGIDAMLDGAPYMLTNGADSLLGPIELLQLLISSRQPVQTSRMLENLLQKRRKKEYLNDQVIPRIRRGVFTAFVSRLNQCCAMLKSLVSLSCWEQNGAYQGGFGIDTGWLLLNSNIDFRLA
jgi:hypothetical protein